MGVKGSKCLFLILIKAFFCLLPLLILFTLYPVSLKHKLITRVLITKCKSAICVGLIFFSFLNNFNIPVKPAYSFSISMERKFTFSNSSKIGLILGLLATTNSTSGYDLVKALKTGIIIATSPKEEKRSINTF